MDFTYWIKQTKEAPLFPELIWSKPENKLHAGKLLIIGGNLHAFGAPSIAFTKATSAGAGSIRLILPDSIKKTVATLIPEADFAPVTPSGSFSKQALDQFIEQSTWADGVLLAGDFGKNSETAILLERFIQEATGPVIIAGDTIDNLMDTPDFANISKVVTVTNFTQFQKLAIKLKFKTAFTSSMSLNNIVVALHEFSNLYSMAIMLIFENSYIIAHKGRISSTQILNPSNTIIDIASALSVWVIQNPTNIFEALTTAVYQS